MQAVYVFMYMDVCPCVYMYLCVTKSLMCIVVQLIKLIVNLQCWRIHYGLD